MKYLAIVLASFIRSSHGGVEVVQNFLSVEECDGILREQALTTPNPSLADGETLGRNLITVASEIKRRMATTMAHVMSSCRQNHHSVEDDQTCIMDPDVHSRLQMYMNSSWSHSDDPEIILTTVKKTTKTHVDCQFNPSSGETELLNDKVGFVFLEDMIEAYFSHQGDEVVPTKGSLVVFDGNKPHNTVFPSGAAGNELHLLGPYTLTNHGHGLTLVVGCDPPPSCGLSTPAPTNMKKSKKKKRPMRK